MTTPVVFTEFARQRGLAPDGRCKAFAAAADGTGMGEGAAVVVLERLSDARRNNHPVLAVIAGSAVNQDGASNGLTAPNGPAQQRVIRQAAANAGIGLDQVDVVEAHGTGTTLGDPIEAGALIATYGAQPRRRAPAVAGVDQIQYRPHPGRGRGRRADQNDRGPQPRELAAHPARCMTPSPHIDWSAGTVRLLTEAIPWPHTDHPRTAAVSSFGISGTNAHLILQQAPAGRSCAGRDRRSNPLQSPRCGSGRSRRAPRSALCAQAERLHQHLLDHPGLDLTDLAYSLATTRTQHPYRAAITAPADTEDPRQDLLEALSALQRRPAPPRADAATIWPGQAGKTVFVFPGQGAQYPGMAAQLYGQHRVFAAALDECDAALRPFTGWSVRDVVCQEPAAPSLDRVDVLQPALFAVMVSLAEVLAQLWDRA